MKKITVADCVQLHKLKERFDMFIYIFTFLPLLFDIFTVIISLDMKPLNSLQEPNWNMHLKVSRLVKLLISFDLKTCN